ncbi:CRISPR system precrRNA processing endoribonuclease RAMP protein Cas6 [Halomonas sp. LS-001]
MTPSAIAISRYRFTLTAQAPFTLRGHPGAMLRGAWGHALRALACSTGRPQCTDCPLTASCRYAVLFEPAPDNQRSIPPPYTFQTPLNAPEKLTAGETFQFDMVLFGNACQELGLVTWAWQDAARRGLGEQRTPMQLTGLACETAPAQWQALWQAPASRLAAAPRIPAHQATLVWEMMPPVPPNGVTLSMTSPLRLQVKGRVVGAEQINAESLLNTLWRRIQLYNKYYLRLPLRERPPVENLHLHTQGLHRQRWQRHSQRQGKSMRLDGLLGTATLHGDLTLWWPWLWLGQYTHLGKNTAFGLGQYQLNAL